MKHDMLVEVWLPIKLGKSFTYRMPQSHLKKPHLGHRAVVPFGGGVTVGVIWGLSQRSDTQGIKQILQIPDAYPLWDEMGCAFITWISYYYLLPVGQVIQKAIRVFRGAFQVEVQHGIRSPHLQDDDFGTALYRLLETEKKVNGSRLRPLLKSDGWEAALHRLVATRVITLVASLDAKTSTQQHVALVDTTPQTTGQLSSPQQHAAIAHYNALAATQKDGTSACWIALQQLLAQGASASSINTLVKKGLFKMEKRPITPGQWARPTMPKNLEPAHEEVVKRWNSHEVVLVTGRRLARNPHWGLSLLHEGLKNQEQGCYLMPYAWDKTWEKGLKVDFGTTLAFYHSRLTPKQKQAIWHGVRNGTIRWVIGTPGAIFLPFKRLQRMIIAEEDAYGHQNEATTWGFQIRDTAIMLAHLHGAKTAITTPVPSLESYYNAVQNKYGSVSLPPIKVNPGNIRVILPQGKASHAMVWPPLVVDKMKKTLAENRQIILIHHRTGYAGYHACGDCHWLASCNNCNVPLRIHQHGALLVCNYCGQTQPPHAKCPSCEGVKLHQGDVGTQQLEELLNILFPKRHVAALTGTTSERTYEHTLNRFRRGKIDFLVATQRIIRHIPPANNYLMIIPNMDGWWKTPHFRAEACVYQWLGRLTAGGDLAKGNEIWLVTQQKNRGRVQDLVVALLGKDELQHGKTLLAERATHQYPPYVRLLKMRLAHQNSDLLHRAASALQSRLTPLLNTPPLGPSPLRNLHQKPQLSITIKMPLGKTKKIKSMVSETVKAFQESKTGRKIKLTVAVDSFL